MTETLSDNLHSSDRVLSERLRAIRRVAIITIIVSLSITALIGIFTLLTGSLDEVKVKVMLTTLVVGILSVLSLCDLAVAGRRFQWAGYLGILAGIVAMVISLILIWAEFGSKSPELLWKTFWIVEIAAVSLAHTNLLLLLGERRRPVVRIGLWITIGLIALLALLLYLLILTDGDIGTDAYDRVVGTVAILDVLGTIVVPVVSKFLRDESRPEVGQIGITLGLSRELSARLAALAAERAMSAEALVLETLQALTRPRE